MRSNQEEINQRISKSLKGRGNSPIKKNCPSCKNEFEVSWSKRHQLSCSRKCSMTNRNLGSTRNETYTHLVKKYMEVELNGMNMEHIKFKVHMNSELAKY